MACSLVLRKGSVTLISKMRMPPSSDFCRYTVFTSDCFPLVLSDVFVFVRLRTFPSSTRSPFIEDFFVAALESIVMKPSVCGKGDQLLSEQSGIIYLQVLHILLEVVSKQFTVECFILVYLQTSGLRGLYVNNTQTNEEVASAKQKRDLQGRPW